MTFPYILSQPSSQFCVLCSPLHECNRCGEGGGQPGTLSELVTCPVCPKAFHVRCMPGELGDEHSLPRRVWLAKRDEAGARSFCPMQSGVCSGTASSVCSCTSQQGCAYLLGMRGRQGADGTHVTMHSRVLLNVLAFLTGEVQPDSEVEQSVIFCRKHRFTHSYDARPFTAPLFSDMQLQSWRCRCLRSCLPHKKSNLAHLCLA